MTSNTLKISVIAGLIMAGLGGAYSIGSGHALSPAQASVPPAQIAPALVATAAAPLTPLPDMSAIVARNGAAVVNISVSGTGRNSAEMPDSPKLDPNDPLFEFYRRFGVPQQRGERPVRGRGCCFILREGGIVLSKSQLVE